MGWELLYKFVHLRFIESAGVAFERLESFALAHIEFVDALIDGAVNECQGFAFRQIEVIDTVAGEVGSCEFLARFQINRGDLIGAAIQLFQFL